MTDDISSPEEAVEWLDNRLGQSYYTADSVWTVLTAFAGHAEDDFVRDHTQIQPEREPIGFDQAVNALSLCLKERQRAADDARGLITVYPHNMVVTASDVSAIICEALGCEESDFSAAGSGFTADGRHDRNVERIRNALEDDD